MYENLHTNFEWLCCPAHLPAPPYHCIPYTATLHPPISLPNGVRCLVSLLLLPHANWPWPRPHTPFKPSLLCCPYLQPLPPLAHPYTGRQTSLNLFIYYCYYASKEAKVAREGGRMRGRGEEAIISACCCCCWCWIIAVFVDLIN